MIETLSSLLWPGVLAVGGLAIGAPAALTLLRNERSRTRRRVGVALGLDRRQRRLIARLARETGMDGTSLLLSRGCFDAAAHHYRGTKSDLARINAMRSQLFEAEADR